MKTMYREDMDNRPCSQCGKPLHINQCGAGLGADCCNTLLLTAKYEAGELTLRCGKCDKFVAAFHIASNVLLVKE